jgi:hypothetical protein
MHQEGPIAEDHSSNPTKRHYKIQRRTHTYVIALRYACAQELALFELKICNGEKVHRLLDGIFKFFQSRLS